MNQVQRLVFRHLYDDKWGVIVKAQHRWGKDKIIFPSGFQPATGQSYDCIVQPTFSGTFHYQGKDYNLCFAQLADEGSVIDVVDFKLALGKKRFSLNPLSQALLAKINKDKLPVGHELIVVEVGPDRKNGGLMLKPQYKISDPAADGRPSMTFFHHNGKEKVVLGQRWRARVMEKKKSGKTNQMGYVILHASIILLEQFRVV